MRAGSTLLAVTAGAIGIAIGAFVRHGTMIGDYPPREIVGTILDRGGAPVEGARVELRDVSDPVNNDLASSRATDRVTISDAHGEFRLRTKDDCVLLVTKSGFAPADVWQAREFMDPITIRLDAGRTFRARVVAAETAQPIVGARIVIASFDLVGGTRSAVTGNDGRIQIDDLPELPSIEYAVIRKDAFAVRDSVDLPANPSSEVVLEVGSGPAFRGRVIDSSTGQPIVDAVIFDASIVGNSVLADRIEVARSTSDGTFTLAGAMFDGFWRLMIVKDGFVPSGIDFEEAGTRVTVGASESPTAKTVRLEKGFHGNTGTDVTSGEWLEPGFVLDVGLVPACAITGTMRRSNGLPAC